MAAALWTVPIAIIGARLYYVLFDPNKNYDSFMDIINITNGGLSIHGAVIFATLFVLFYTKKKGVSFWLIADIVAVGFLIGQIVGRWGNFMNQEAYGPIIESQFILNILPAFIKDQMFIRGNFHHPTFLYEALWCTLVAVSLIVFGNRWKPGQVFAGYVFAYCLGRFFIELIRIDSANTIAGLRVNVWVSVIVGVGSLLYFARGSRKNA